MFHNEDGTIHRVGLSPVQEDVLTTLARQEQPLVIMPTPDEPIRGLQSPPRRMVSPGLWHLFSRLSK